MSRWPALKAAPSALALAIFLSGCATQATDTAYHARHHGTTLADLENVEIDIDQTTIDSVSARSALESYRRAIELAQDPETKLASMRRMADLALTTAESRSLLEDIDAEQVDLSEDPAAQYEIDQSVDRLLYENFMRGAQDSDLENEQYALLDLASGTYGSIDEHHTLDTDYATAIELYKRLLSNSTDPAQRAEAYYLLAKAYDLNGNFNDTLNTLDILVKEHPSSPYYYEAQFRRGEMMFSNNEFDGAADAYNSIVSSRTPTEFHDQAQYKLGWSLYKLSDYRDALHHFFALYERFRHSPELSVEESMTYKLVSDVRRVISLAFINLEGGKSVQQWFASRGRRDYEHEIYRSLGDVYLQQERYREAATTYELFVDSYPLNPLAPEFSTLNILAYEKGGFPSLVLPAKESFVERYGIHSDFWQQHPERDSYAPQVRSHILDLAKHYHSVAQREKKAESFAVAARWYQEYLITPPAGENQANVHQLYAQALFEGEQFEQAITEYERVAYEYPGYEQAPEAAFLVLVSFESLIEKLPQSTDQEKAELDQWLLKKIDSSLRFAKAYPSHEQVPAVLAQTLDDQLVRKDITGAIATAGHLVSLNPPPKEELQVLGWSTIANGEFDLGRYDAAEFAYGRLLGFSSLTTTERTRHSEQLAASVYKQGEALQQAGDLAAAADQYLRVKQVYPQASIRKNAEFDAATLLMQLESYEQAIPILEAFRQSYPQDALTETIPDRLAIAYEKTGNYSAAAGELELIAANYARTDRELSRQALWQAAEMQDRAEQPEGSIRLYRSYVASHPQPLDFQAEAHYRLAGLYEKTGNMNSYQQSLNALVKIYNQAGNDASDRIAWLAAWSSFTLAQPRYDEFVAIKLNQPLRRSLERKSSVMRDALQRYEAIADIGVAEYVTASNYQISQLYQLLAKDMMDSERPNGLDELELEEYELLLEEQALPYEDQAIDILIANAELVGQNVYDKWVKLSFEQLATLLPGRFAKQEQIEDYVDIIY